MKQPFVCKIAYPVETRVPASFFYAYGFLSPARDTDEVKAEIRSASGVRIPGHRRPTFFPYNWCFLFFNLPAVLESYKLIVTARDALGRRSRDVSHAVLGPPTHDVTIIISSPADTPSLLVAGTPFSTWGLISDLSKRHTMTATVACTSPSFSRTEGPPPVTPLPPSPYDWQFNFTQIPANLKGSDGTLTVTADSATPVQRGLRFG